jgi:hypothetical protein
MAREELGSPAEVARARRGAPQSGDPPCEPGTKASFYPKTEDKTPIVDVAKAETVVELLGFPECVLDMVVRALLNAG